MTNKAGSGKGGYEKYVNYKWLALAAAAFALLLLIPLPASMLDVAVEYSAGEKYILDFFANELFQKPFGEVEQWQALGVQVMEKSMRQGALGRKGVLRLDAGKLKKLGLSAPEVHLEKVRQLVENIPEERFQQIMAAGQKLRLEQLTYQQLKPAERKKADAAAWSLKVCVALVAFVVICFITEAVPLPGVAFCIGLILVFTGVVSREDVASLFWSDAAWFIMGSLMFAAAFVKTGVDKRLCLAIFRFLAKRNIKWIIAMLILVIAPAASFISDHALAAMFLPIAMILYQNSLNEKTPADPELAKLLVIGIAMACNIGGFGAPSGGARNVIIMTYMEDMFGLQMSYGQWVIMGMPFVLIMMPVLWLLLRWRFKPRITDMGPALDTLKKDIERMGGWNRKQVLALLIFAIMLFGWITESNLLESWLGVRLGIGVLAVAGGVAYLLCGVASWKDYQEKVEWGVVWLYAGAIIFGRVLDRSGAAYWMARSVVEGMTALGLSSGEALLGIGSLVTAGMTQLMADGPAAAAVGPVTLNMAAVAAPNTLLVPFMGLATSCAASFAYLLIIGTPPNAIVYASGYLVPRDFLRVGIPCLLAAFLVLFLLAVFYWPLIGFAGLPGY